MRFLLDENLPRRLGSLLRARDHEAVHVGDLNLAGAGDEAILQEAQSRGAVLLTHDLDFGRLLAVSGQPSPSVIQFRLASNDADRLQALLMATLPGWRDAVAAGALVVIEDETLRIRSLPIRA